MRVILKETISNLGRTGDIINVRDGYARNFLLPKGLVVQANETNVKEIQHHKRILEKKRLAEKASAEELATRVGEQEVIMLRKVGKNDKLFGSVSPQDISDSLKEKGFEVDKSLVQLKDNLKTLGSHMVEIRFQPDVSTRLKVTINKEE